jgi:hypothetical protein
MPYKDPARRRAATKAWRDHPDHRQADRMRKSIERNLKPKPVSLDPTAGAGDRPDEERKVQEFLARVRAERPEDYDRAFARYPVLTEGLLQAKRRNEDGIANETETEDALPPSGTVSEGKIYASTAMEGVSPAAYGLAEIHEDPPGVELEDEPYDEGDE